MNITTSPFAPRTEASVWRVPSVPGSSKGGAGDPGRAAGVWRLTIADAPGEERRGGKRRGRIVALPNPFARIVPVAFHADPAAFAAAARGVASRSPCSEALVAIWCANLARHPPAPDVPLLLATVESNGARALAMRFGPNQLLIEHSDPAAARELAHALVDGGHAIPGVEGGVAACAAFAEAWRERTGRVAVERVRLRHHVLESVEPVAAASGAMRTADEGDLDWLVVAHDAFADEAKVPRAPQGTGRMVRDRLGERRFRVWEDPAAVSFLGTVLVDGAHARIGPVYTPPASRGRGYATALVAAASRELLERGAGRVFLTTDLANPVSNAMYARVGYRPVDDTVGYDFVEP